MSNLIGEGGQSMVLPLCQRVINICYCFCIPLILVGFIFPDLFLTLYTDSPVLIQESLSPLYVMLSSFLLSVPAFVFYCAISGTGNTFMTLKIGLLALAAYILYIEVLDYFVPNVSLLWTSELIWCKLQAVAQRKEYHSKSVLLESGRISEDLYLIENGCLRLWFNNNGKDVTFQFFFEGQGVSSVESFLYNRVSIFSIEAIESSSILVIGKKDFMHILDTFPECKEMVNQLLIERLINYTHLFLSRIKDSPKERYDELIKTHPEILKRVPQHYIASYLGITPVSLSRIRSRR